MTSSLKLRFDSGRRRAVLLSATKVVTYEWDGAGLSDSYLFDQTEEGQVYFDKYLKDTGRYETFLVVDLVEEEYRQETLPHVFGSDRKAVIKRKKDRLFRDTPYFNCKIQGRMEEGRRDDHALFTALTNPELVQTWVEILLQNKTPLAGIYSIPQITSLLLDKLPDPSDHMLIISLHSISGLRQTFFRKKELKVSRLVDMPRFNSTPYAPIIREEVEVISRYLNSLRLIDADEPYDVYFLGDSKLLNELRHELEDSPSVRHHLINISAFGRECGIEVEQSTPFSEKLFIHRLLKERPRNCYAQKKEMRYFRLSRIGKCMHAASVVLLLAALIWGTFNVTTGFSFKKQAEVALNLYEYYNGRLKAAREELTQTPVTPYELKNLVEIADKLDQSKTNPASLFRLLSNSLRQFPDIEISRIEWQTDNEAATGSRTKLLPGPENPAALNPVGLTGSEGQSFDFYQSVLVEGMITPFEGDFRDAFRKIDGFTGTINEYPEVIYTTVLTRPLNVGPDDEVSGSSDESQLEARFSVRLVLGVNIDE